jgi:hypothetical protein
MKMRTKNLMVFFLAIVSMLALVATASALSSFQNPSEIVNTSAEYSVKINGVDYEDEDIISVVAGDTVTVKLTFTANVSTTDVRMKASIEGDKNDVDERTDSFDVESGKIYTKTLTLEVPSNLKDDLSEGLELYLKVWNGDLKSETSDGAIKLSVQRPSYNADIKSVSVASSVDAGTSLPVDIVMKNTGYNNLDDLYVTVSIAELGVSKTAYFGDLVAIKNSSDDDDDDEDTVSGRLYLDVPYDAQAGVYTLDVKAASDDGTVANTAKQIVINNDFSAGEVIRNGEGLLIVNPTNKLKVYRVVFPESESYVTVSAGTSKTISVEPTSDNYTVSVLSMNGDAVGTFNFSSTTEDKSSFTANPQVVLFAVLAIVFVVLLIVFIVLIGKKPEKSEDFGESYY